MVVDRATPWVVDGKSSMFPGCTKTHGRMAAPHSDGPVRCKKVLSLRGFIVALEIVIEIQNLFC